MYWGIQFLQQNTGKDSVFTKIYNAVKILNTKFILKHLKENLFH